MKMSKQDREWLSSHTKFSLGLSVDEIEAMQAELQALRAVAQAVERLEAHELGTFAEFGHIPNEDLSDEYMRSLLYAAYEAMRAARDAGHLPAQETRP